MSRRARVLVVDDHIDARAIATEVLRGTYEVLDAENAADALSLAEQHVPDAVLVDFSMPGLDGVQLIRQLRKIDRLKRACVVMVTAHLNEALRAKALTVGADALLPKPFEGRDLLRILSVHLRDREPV